MFFCTRQQSSRKTFINRVSFSFGMYGWRNFKHKFKKYAPPDKTEVRGLLITVVVFAFIISFRGWGTNTFSAKLGIANYFLALVLMLIAFFIYEVGHKVFALWIGFKSEYKAWIPGLLISLVFAFLSNGYIPLMLIGGSKFTRLELHRLGRFQPELSMKHIGWIGMSGSITLMIFAVILKPFSSSTVIFTLMKICILLAIFNMLPIPPMNGLRTFFGSRFIYVFVTSSLVACGALLVYVNGVLSLIGGIILGALALLLFFTQVDNRW